MAPAPTAASAARSSASQSTKTPVKGRLSASTPRKSGEKATCSNGTTRSTTSRVERIRQQTGVGYVGLNVSEDDLEAVSDGDQRSIVWFDIGDWLLQGLDSR